MGLRSRGARRRPRPGRGKRGADYRHDRALRCRTSASPCPTGAMSAAAIIVAGGLGTRMAARVNKIFMEVAGRSILEHALELFESDPRVHQVVLVARQADLSRCEPLRARFSKLNWVVAGGDVRHRSEFAGLRALAAQIDAGQLDTVLVHDAVRPFATHALVDRLLVSVAQTIGCIPGLLAGRGTALVADGWIAGYP